MQSTVKFNTVCLFWYVNKIFTISVCNRCAPGYYGDPTKVGGSCRPCSCGGNIDGGDPGGCDRETGECLKCLNHTEGPNCQRCQDGYYGRAVNGDCTGGQLRTIGSKTCCRVSLEQQDLASYQLRIVIWIKYEDWPVQSLIISVLNSFCFQHVIVIWMARWMGHVTSIPGAVFARTGFMEDVVINARYCHIYKCKN